MTRTLAILACLFLLGGPIIVAIAAMSAQESDILVGFVDGVSDLDADAVYSLHGKRIETFRGINVHRVRTNNPSGAILALQRHPGVRFAELNHRRELQVLPNDPSYPSQWHLPKISAPQAWDTETGDRQITVAVIDTGVDGNHPDLAAQMVPGRNVLANSSDTADSTGHGTAVSGVIGAIGNNSVGVAGVNWSVGIMPVRICNSPCDSVLDSTLTAAIMWAADNGADVINLSVGGWPYSNTLQNAVNYAWSRGVTIIAAACNFGSSSPCYPAALDNVIAVSATDQNDNLASFSNYGSWIDVAAPGVGVFTTNSGGGYGGWNGTSFSSPNVAGLAALILGVNAALSNADVVGIIKNNADDLGSGFDELYGWGRINASRAVNAVGVPPPPPPPPGDTTPPVIQSSSIVYDGKFITASATVTDSDSGVARVELLMDSSVIKTDSSAPYSFKVNTKPWPKGNHSVSLRAVDNAGNSSVTPGMTIFIR